ncbi:MAG: hypothetical protein SGJ18_02180 [Pseudomonadota bacterium]|nr:hypothetical protein [Pseudomonadota bacterium]
MPKKAYFTDCPRCGLRSFEHLSDYAHCPNCLYFEDYYEDTETCYSAARAIEIIHMRPIRKIETDKIKKIAS